MATRSMRAWRLPLLILIVLLSAWGCTRSDTDQDRFEKQMLKVLLDREIAESAQVLFNASYDPANGSLMQTADIFAYLEERELPVDALPPDLQAALKRNRVVGVLVSRLDALPVQKVQFIPVKLDALHKMLLAWEMKTGGYRAIWINGGSGLNSGDADNECPNDLPRCADYPDCCEGEGKFCLCIGVYQCPPCTHLCKQCPSGPGDSIASNPDGENAVARSSCDVTPKPDLVLSDRGGALR